mmetsp:Transcript_20828/g.48710  ORF Transcript_20828/g.48710 Transcript_20828/m.48710 type:complete len:210 (-) Transcript_20828:461-1090(-)
MRQIQPRRHFEQVRDDVLEFVELNHAVIVQVVSIEGTLVTLNVQQAHSMLPRDVARDARGRIDANRLREAEGRVPGDKLPNVDVASAVSIGCCEARLDKLFGQLVSRFHVADVTEEFREALVIKLGLREILGVARRVAFKDATGLFEVAERHGGGCVERREGKIPRPWLLRFAIGDVAILLVTPIVTFILQDDAPKGGCCLPGDDLTLG